MNLTIAYFPVNRPRLLSKLSRWGWGTIGVFWSDHQRWWNFESPWQKETIGSKTTLESSQNLMDLVRNDGKMYGKTYAPINSAVGTWKERKKNWKKRVRRMVSRMNDRISKKPGSQRFSVPIRCFFPLRAPRLWQVDKSERQRRGSLGCEGGDDREGDRAEAVDGLQGLRW